MQIEIISKINDFLSALDQEVGRSICRTYQKSAHRLVTYGTLETTLNIEKMKDTCERVPGMQIFPTSLPYPAFPK
jgi:hypothetical protein